MKDTTKLDNTSRSKRSREYDSLFGDDEYAAATNEKRRKQTKTYWEKLSTPNPRYMQKDAEEPPRKKTRVCISNKFCPPRIDQLAIPTTPRLEGVLSEYHKTLEPERVVRIVKLIHTNQEPKPIRHTVKRRKKKRPTRRLKKRNKAKLANQWLDEQTDVSAQLIMESLGTKVAYTPNYKQVILSLGLMKTLKPKNKNYLFRENLLKTCEQLAIIADREWEPYQYVEDDIETESEEDLKPDELKKHVVYRLESTASMTSVEEGESEEGYATPSSEAEEEDYVYMGKVAHEPGKYTGPATIYEDTEEDERPGTIKEEPEEEDEEVLQDGTEFEDIKEEQSAGEDEEAIDVKEEPEESEQIKEEDATLAEIKAEEASIKEELAAEVKSEEASIKEELAAEVKNEEQDIKEEVEDKAPEENTAEESYEAEAAALGPSEPSEAKEIEPAVGEETLEKAESIKETEPEESAAVESVTKESKVEEEQELVDTPKEGEIGSEKGVDEETTEIKEGSVKEEPQEEVFVKEEEAAQEEEKLEAAEEEKDEIVLKEEEAAEEAEKLEAAEEEKYEVVVKEEEAAEEAEKLEAAEEEKYEVVVKEEEAAEEAEKLEAAEEEKYEVVVKEEEAAEEEAKLEAAEEEKEEVEEGERTSEEQSVKEQEEEEAISTEKEISSERTVFIQTASGDKVAAIITIGENGEEMIELEDSQGKRTSVPLKSLITEEGVVVLPEEMQVTRSLEEAKPQVLAVLSEHTKGTASYVAYRVYSTWLEEFGHNIQTYSSCLKSFSEIVAKSQLDDTTNAARHSPAIREVLLNWSSYLAETMQFESAMKDYFKGKPVTRCNKCSDSYNMYNLPSEDEHPLPVELRAALAHTAQWKQLLANAEKQSILLTALVESDSFTSSFITVDIQDVSSILSSESAYIVEELEED